MRQIIALKLWKIEQFDTISLMILIYTTHSSKEEAQKLTSLLFERKLIACVNYFAMESSYEWESDIQTEQETVAIYKTNEENWKEAEKTILEHHPYDTPCVIKLEARANDAFEKWVNETTRWL